MWWIGKSRSQRNRRFPFTFLDTGINTHFTYRYTFHESRHGLCLIQELLELSTVTLFLFPSVTCVPRTFLGVHYLFSDSRSPTVSMSLPRRSFLPYLFGVLAKSVFGSLLWKSSLPPTTCQSLLGLSLTLSRWLSLITLGNRGNHPNPPTTVSDLPSYSCLPYLSLFTNRIFSLCLYIYT